MSFAGTYRGPFDPVNFDPDDPTTFPPPGPSGLYQKGDFWLLAGPVTIGGVDFRERDRLYALGHGRRFGEMTFGGGVFGPPDDRDWLPQFTEFAAFNSSDPPWEQLSPPGAGCPLGDRWPGWRLVVEAFYDNDPAHSRRFAEMNFGDGPFGDPLGLDAEQWVDITTYSFDVSIRHGSEDGGTDIPVSEISLELRDPDEDLVIWSIPAKEWSLGYATPIRIGVTDPQYGFHPLGVGRIETIEDVHDAPPRHLSIQAVGLYSDLVTYDQAWQRPVEYAVGRAEFILAEDGWRWGGMTFPDPHGYHLLADADPSGVELRAELDRTMISSGWVADCDRFGRLRARNWPLEPTGTPIVVSDCPADADPGALPLYSMTIVADGLELLNKVVVENILDPADGGPGVGYAIDQASVDRVRLHTEAFGFPLTGLSTRSQTDLDTIAGRILGRQSRAITRVENLEIDAALDDRWLDVLARLDTGRAVSVQRRGIPSKPFDMDAVIVAYEHRLTPNHWETTVSTMSVSPTF